MIKPLTKRPKELKGLFPSLIVKDSEYLYSKIQFYPFKTDLYIRLSGAYQPSRWHIIRDYHNYTALEVITFVDWGRHFEDGTLKIWANHDLDLGWLKPIMRRI